MRQPHVSGLGLWSIAAGPGVNVSTAPSAPSALSRVLIFHMLFLQVDATDGGSRSPLFRLTGCPCTGVWLTSHALKENWLPTVSQGGRELMDSFPFHTRVLTGWILPERVLQAAIAAVCLWVWCVCVCVKYMYVLIIVKKQTMNLKESKEGYMEGFVGNNERGNDVIKL